MRSIRDARSQPIHLPFVAAVLADGIREVRNKALLVLAYLERVTHSRVDVVLPGGDDAVGRHNVAAVQVRGELHSRQANRLFQERDTCER